MSRRYIMFSNIVRAAPAGTRSFTTRGIKPGGQTQIYLDTTQTLPTFIYKGQTCGGIPMSDAMRQFTKAMFDPQWLYRGFASLNMALNPIARELTGVPARSKKDLSLLEEGSHLADTASTVKAGLPTSSKKEVADRFARSLLDRLTFGWLGEGAVIVIDRNGISDNNLTIWDKKHYEEANRQRAMNDKASLPMEFELTLHNLADWNVPFAETKSNGKISLIANPMYIDFLALNKNLQEEYEEIYSHFHEECLKYMTTGKPVSQDYQEKVGSFYAKASLYSGTSLEQMKDIMIELSDTGALAFKNTYINEFKNSANPSIANDMENLLKKVKDFDPKKVEARTQSFFKNQAKTTEVEESLNPNKNLEM